MYNILYCVKYVGIFGIYILYINISLSPFAIQKQFALMHFSLFSIVPLYYVEAFSNVCIIHEVKRKYFISKKLLSQ